MKASVLLLFVINSCAAYDYAIYGGCINRSLNGEPESDGTPHFHCHFDSTYCGSNEEWIPHSELAGEGLGPCTCDYEYKANVYLSACYDVASTHRLKCAAEDNQCPDGWSQLGPRFGSGDLVSDECGHMSDAYGAFESTSCGKRCNCMFTYTSGTETLTALSTRYGSCHGPSPAVPYCAIKASSCEADETFHGAWDDLSENLDCDCSETLTGACVTTRDAEFISCAVSIDSCGAQSFISARELRDSPTLTNECRLCNGEIPTPAPTTSASPTDAPTVGSTPAPTISHAPSISMVPTEAPPAPIELAVYGGCINRALGGLPAEDGTPHFHCHYDQSSCTQDEEWLNHAQVEEESLGPCTCDDQYATNVFAHACYDQASSHQLVCAAETTQCPAGWMNLGPRFSSDKPVRDDCGHLSNAYADSGGFSCGKRCTCAFSYASGVKPVELGVTRFGSCHDTQTSLSYCAVKQSSCATGEVFYGAFESETAPLECSCDKTLVGACVTEQREFVHCAVSEDSCAQDNFFLGARELRLSTELGNNCRLCRDTWTPTPSPTEQPTISSTDSPTLSPTDSPTTSPTASPTNEPSPGPSATPSLSVSPTISLAPSMKPSTSSKPSHSPSSLPSNTPSVDSSTSPSKTATAHPTNHPTVSKSDSPSASPTTAAPTTISPTITCADDPTFRVSGKSQKNCRWISANENRRLNACGKYTNTHRFCPVTCGLCCADNLNFE